MKNEDICLAAQNNKISVDLVGMIKSRGTYSTIMHPTPEEQALDKTTPPEKLRQLAKQSPELARLVAKNENADPELLRELASSADKTTREGVTTNPNTPTEVLLKLTAEFPQQLLDNLAFIAIGTYRFTWLTCG